MSTIHFSHSQQTSWVHNIEKYRNTRGTKSLVKNILTKFWRRKCFRCCEKFLKFFLKDEVTYWDEWVNIVWCHLYGRRIVSWMSTILCTPKEGINIVFAFYGCHFDGLCPSILNVLGDFIVGCLFFYSDLISLCNFVRGLYSFIFTVTIT